MRAELLCKPRYEFIDLAKGFCIILVVLNHFFPSIFCGTSWAEKVGICVQSFRMPLYFILSGMFFSKYSGFLEFLIKKINRLLFPFVSFYIIGYLMHVFFCFLEGRYFDWISIFAFPKDGIKFNFPIWFILCLFLCGIFFYLILSFSESMGKSVCFRTFIISFIVGTIGVVLGRFNINLPLFIDTAFTAVPFYSFGYFLRKKTTFLQNNTYSKYYVLLSIILFVATFFLARPIDMRTNFSKNVASLYVCGVMGTLSILFLTKKIIHLPIISYFGRYSICILLTHMPIFGLIKKIFGLLISDTETCDILNSDFIPALFVLFSYIYIIPLMVKYMPHICAQKDIFFFKKIQ